MRFYSCSTGFIEYTQYDACGSCFDSQSEFLITFKVFLDMHALHSGSERYSPKLSNEPVRACLRNTIGHRQNVQETYSDTISVRSFVIVQKLHLKSLIFSPTS